MDAHGNALVTTPLDMAHVLLRASAFSAAAYALASHETACERGDDDRIEFWHAVCRELDALREQADAPSMRRVA